MFVVLMSARGRALDGDESLVNELIDKLLEKYGSSLVVVSGSLDEGVGYYCRNRRVRDKNTQFIEFDVKIYASLSKVQALPWYDLRNVALAQQGDEFHLFLPDRGRKHSLGRMLEVIEANNRPVRLYYPGDGIGDLS